MQIHVHWLDEMVEVPARDVLARVLSEAGVEVEGIDDPRSRARGVLVAKVTAVEPHPDAESLHVCQVDDGQNTHTVVCGAKNVTVGMLAAYAPVGARLGNITIAPKKLRGVLSAGMLCARGELGLLPDEDGLWVLPTDWSVGADIGVASGMADVFDLSITPNRPDLLCHYGVAREVAAGTQKRLRASKWRVAEKGPEVSTLARAIVEDHGACRRYVGRVVRNLRIGPSPLWLRERLHAIGQRPINNVVDVTNYVMQELGAPLHAYDLQALAVDMGLPTVRVRRAEAGESLTTLDGVVRTLDAADLVIADARGPVALAGIMGGARSQVSDGTTQVLIEGASFEAATVRRSAKRHGLRTEASLRFERGADAGIVAKAVERCVQLLTDLAQGEVAKGSLDVQQKNDGPKEILLRFARVERILGVPIAPEALVALLEPLEIRCTRRTEAALVFEVPSFRPDIEREIDLIEEVARRHGYDRLPERLPSPTGTTTLQPPKERSGEAARRALLSQGVSECVHFAFVKPEQLTPYGACGAGPVELLNPLGSDQRALRTTLLPGLLATLQRNLRRGQSGASLFEVGTVFWQRASIDTSAAAASHEGLPAAAVAGHAGAPPDARREAHAASGVPVPAVSNEDLPPVVGDEMRAARVAACDARLPHEEVHVACVCHGPRHPQRHYDADARLGFADAKGLLEGLLEAYDPDATIAYAPLQLEVLNPHACAEVTAVLSDGHRQSLGYLGQLDPAYATAQELPQDVFVLQVNLSALQALPRRPLAALPLPKFPSTRRDLAIIAPAALPAEELRTFIVAHAGGVLGAAVIDDVQLFDVYTGRGVADGMVSLAFAIRYVSHERTLTDAEVTPAFLAMIEALKGAFKVEVRDGSGTP